MVRLRTGKGEPLLCGAGVTGLPLRMPVGRRWGIKSARRLRDAAWVKEASVLLQSDVTGGENLGTLYNLPVNFTCLSGA